MRKQIIENGGPVDLFVDLPVSLQTLKRGLQEAFLARFLGSRFVMGFDLLLPTPFKKYYAREFSERISETGNWLLKLISAAPTSKDTILDGSFQTLNLAAYGLNPQLPLFAINAGAKLEIKRWPPESFALAISQVLRKHPGFQIVLLGSAAEVLLNEEIASGVKERHTGACVVNLSGKLALPETWALLKQAELVLSNDTGTMHMAGLLGKPTVTPMSGQYPAPLWHPFGNNFISLRQPPPCSPCFLDKCKFADQVCLTRITPEAVAAELDRLASLH